MPRSRDIVFAVGANAWLASTPRPGTPSVDDGSARAFATIVTGASLVASTTAVDIDAGATVITEAAAVSATGDVGAVVLETTFTVPAALYLIEQQIPRSTGRQGGLLTLHYIELGASHYLWWRQGPVAPDPGAFVPALSGRTGIVVDTGTSSLTPTANATAVAAAITAFGDGLSATSSDASVTVSGVASHTYGPTGYDATTPQGILGTPDDRVLGLNSLESETLRAVALDLSHLTEPIILTGASIGVGDVHTAACALRVYQGGVSDTDTTGATPLGVLGTTATGTTNAWCPVHSQGVLVDPAAGRVWVAWMHDPGGFEMSFTWAANNASAGNNYVVASGNVIRILESGGGLASSNPADFPATLGAPVNNEIGMPAFRISFVDADEFQSDCEPAFRFGTHAGIEAGVRDDSHTFGSSVGGTLIAANSYAIPAELLGMGVELDSASISYTTHVLGSDYRLFAAVGGAADNNMDGAHFYDIGQTTGDAVGWNDVSAPAGIPLEGSTRLWLGVKFNDSGSGISFDNGGPNEFEDEHWGQALWYLGNTSESEFEPGEGESALNFNPSVATPVGVHNFVGTNQNPNNNIGMYGVATCRRG